MTMIRWIVFGFIFFVGVFECIQPTSSFNMDHSGASPEDYAYYSGYSSGDNMFYGGISSGDNSGNMRAFRICGNITLPSETWIQALNNKTSPEFQALNQSVLIKVWVKAIEDGHGEDLMYFEVLRFVPAKSKGVIAEYCMVVMGDETDLDDLFTEVKDTLNSIDDFQNATIADWETFDYDYSGMNSGDYSGMSSGDYSGMSSGDYSGDKQTIGICGNITLPSETWIQALNNKLSPEFQALNQSVHDEVWIKAIEDGHGEDLMHFEVLRFLPAKSEGVIVRYCMVVMGDITDLDDVFTEVKDTLNSIDGFQNATTADWEIFDNDYSGMSSGDYSGDKQTIRICGNITLPSETWIPAMNNKSSPEFQALNLSVVSKVWYKAIEDGHGEDLMHFEVLRFVPAESKGVITVYCMVVMSDETDLDDLFTEVKDTLNSIDGFQNATIGDWETFDYDYSGMNSGDYSGDKQNWKPFDYDYSGMSSGDYSGNKQTIRICGNITLPSETWIPAMNNKSSPEFQALNLSVVSKVWYKAIEDGHGEDLMHFEVLRFVPAESKGVITVYCMVVMSDETDLDDLFTEVKDTLNSIDGFQNATIGDWETFDYDYSGMNSGDYSGDKQNWKPFDYDYSGMNSGDYSGNKQTIRICGNITLPSETWIPAMNNKSSPEFQALNLSVVSKVWYKAIEDGHGEDLMHFEVLRFVPAESKGVITVYCMVVMSDETDLDDLFTEVKDTLNSIDGFQNATIGDWETFVYDYSGMNSGDYSGDKQNWKPFDYDYSGMNSGDYSGNKQTIRICGNLTLPSETWIPAMNNKSSPEFQALNLSVVSKVWYKAIEDGHGEDLMHFEVLRFVPAESKGVITVYCMVVMSDETDLDDLFTEVKDTLNSIAGFQNATIGDWETFDYDYSGMNSGDYSGDKQNWKPFDYDYSGMSSGDYSGNKQTIRICGNLTLPSETWIPAMNNKSSPEFQALNLSVVSKVWYKAIEDGHGEDLMHFEVLRFVPAESKGVITVYCMVVMSDETDLDDLFTEVKDTLNSIDGFQNATIADWETFDYDYSGMNSGDYSGDKQTIRICGNITLPSETWILAMNNKSSPEFQALNQSVVSKVWYKAIEDGHGEDLMHFEVLRFVPAESKGVITVYCMVVMSDETDLDDLFTEVKDTLNSIDGFQNATIADWETFDYDYSGMSSGDYSGDKQNWSEGDMNVTFFTEVVMVGDVPKLALKCGFERQSDNENVNDGYVIELYADNEPIFTSGTMSKETADTFFVTSEDLVINGFALEKSYKCGVNVYQPGNAEPILTGQSAEEQPINVELEGVQIQRGEDMWFEIEINIPLPCSAGTTCYIDVKLVDVDENNKCEDTGLAFINKDTCGLRIIGSSNYNEPVGRKSIRMTTINNKKYYTNKTVSRLAIKFEPHGQVESFWEGMLQIEIPVKDDNAYWKGRFSYSVNDPSICTIDGTCFRLNEFNEFRCYKVKDRHVEVQITTEPCLGGACTCGVAVRAGGDLFLIDHCAGLHTTFEKYSGKGNLFVEEIYPGFYEIHLPRGTVVVVFVSPDTWFSFTMVNVFIFPSPHDIGNVEGLCAFYDENTSPSAWSSDGRSTFGSEWLFDEHLSFIDKWRLSDENSLWSMLLSDVEFEDLDDEDETLCVCTGTDDQAVVLCSKQEERLCVDDDTNAEIVRRSAERPDAHRKKKREIDGHMMDERHLRRRIGLRNERRAHIIGTRKKRNSDPSSSLNYTEWYKICESSMNGKCGILISENDTDSIVNNTNAIVSCALDKQANGSVNWEDSSCGVARAAVQYAIAKNTTLNETVVSKVNKTLCPNLCCGNGDCIDGRYCSCYEGFIKSDCSLNRTKPVNMLTSGNDLCEKPCSKIPVMSDSGISDTADCKATHKQILSPNYTVVDQGEVPCSLQIKSSYEANITVGTSRRRRRSTDGASTVAAIIYDVSVSNDGTTYGSSASVAVLDSTCLTLTGSGDNITVTLASNYCLIDGDCYLDGTNNTGQTCNYCDVSSDTFGWTLNSDSCLISEVCYTNGTVKSGETCKFCHVTADNSDWTSDNETGTAKSVRRQASCLDTDSSSESSGLEGHVIAIIVLTVILALGGSGVGGYFLWKKYEASRARNRGLHDSVRNPRFTLRVEPTKDMLLDYEEKGHPQPNLYEQYAAPNPGSEEIPENLYTERGNGNHNEAPTPTLPHTPQGGPERAHTPNMPNIES